MVKRKRKSDGRKRDNNDKKPERKTGGQSWFNRNRQAIGGILFAVFLALVLAFFIRYFFVQAFKIPSGSMEDTLLVGDYLLVNKFIYGIPIPFTDKHVFGIRKPRRGDIIVFKYPHDPDTDFIKRVIGLPGETVEIIRKEVYINGKRVEFEPYVRHKDAKVQRPREHGPSRDFCGPVKVKPGHYFVMGDNRDSSSDSRFWGQLDGKSIRGCAFMIYFSIHRRGFLFIPRIMRIGSLLY